MTIWETLSAIDCSDHVEKKNGFSYLSWAWAWATLKTHYPEATFYKHQSTTTGLPFFKDPDTHHAYVCVTLTVKKDEDPITEVYPVLNHANKPVEHPSNFDVNTALQRCLVKAMAYFGLGHYIYAGEDLPPLPKVADIVGPDGTQQAKGVEMIEKVFLEFLPKMNTNVSLEEFWKNNRTAIAVLKEHDETRYGKVVGAFKKQKDSIPVE